MTFHYLDDDHQIDRPGLWVDLEDDEELTGWDFSGDTQEFPTALDEALEALEDETTAGELWEAGWEPDDF